MCSLPSLVVPDAPNLAPLLVTTVMCPLPDQMTVWTKLQAQESCHSFCRNAYPPHYYPLLVQIPGYWLFWGPIFEAATAARTGTV